MAATQEPTPVGSVTTPYVRKLSALATLAEATPEEVKADSIVTYVCDFEATKVAGATFKVTPSGGAATTVASAEQNKISTEKAKFGGTFFVPAGGSFEWVKITAAPEAVKVSIASLR